MKKRSLYFIAILLVWCCTMKEKDISYLIKEAISKDSTCLVPVFMDKISKVQYDHYILIAPYTQVERLEKNNQLDVQLIKSSGMEFRDDIYLLCLISDGKIIETYTISAELNPEPTTINKVRDKEVALFFICK